MARLVKYKCFHCDSNIFWHENKFYLRDKKVFVHGKCLLKMISECKTDFKKVI